MHDTIPRMAEKLEPYRRIAGKEVADRTDGGRGLFGMRHRRMKEKTARKINRFRERVVNEEVPSLSAENLFLKNPEHQQQLILVNDVLQKYCTGIGVQYKPVPAHAISTISKAKKHPETYNGKYQSTTGMMYIDDEIRGFELFWTTLHEVIHAIGSTTFNVSKDGWSSRRIGYEQSTTRGRQFSGFNEGVIEHIVHEIAVSQYNDIAQRLHEIKSSTGVDAADTRYEFAFQPHDYDAHRSLVSDVMQREAYARQHEQEGEIEDDTLLLKYLEPVQAEMVHGYLSGNMMHLRSIEQHFGEGSLRLIAALRDTDGYGSERGVLFRDYFATLSDEWPTRLRIASEFIENSESFALYVRANTEVSHIVTEYISAPFPSIRNKEYERHIGLACGVLLMIERALRTHSGPHSRRMHGEYKTLLEEADTLRAKYMKTFNLNANDVPVLTERPERHLTIRKSD